MARVAADALFVCRSCLRQHSKPSVLTSRSFSNSARLAKTIPKFEPTSNPELDLLFSTFREEIFTPFALSQHHRDLMYKPSRSQILLNDPGVTVTLSDNEEVKLMPRDPRGKPPKHKSLKRLMELLETSSNGRDWSNLPSFLTGMQMAKEAIPDVWLEKLVRKANENGRTGVIIRCAEMIKKTGICLANPLISREIMIGLHMKAAKAGWKGPELEEALMQAQRVAQLMEYREHCGGKLKDGQRDMRRDLTVAGVLLELAAARAIHANGGKDIGGEVTMYAERLIPLFDSGSFVTTDQTLSHQLEGWLPLWNGMKLALNVQAGADSSLSALHPRVDKMTSSVEAAVKRVTEMIESQGEEPTSSATTTTKPKKRRRSLIMYNELNQPS